MATVVSATLNNQGQVVVTYNDGSTTVMSQDQAKKQAHVNELESATKAKALDGTYGKLDISRD